MPDLDNTQKKLGPNDISVRVGGNGIEYLYNRKTELKEKATVFTPNGTSSTNFASYSNELNFTYIPDSQSKIGKTVIENSKRAKKYSVVWTLLFLISFIVSIVLGFLEKPVVILMLLVLILLGVLRLAYPKWFFAFLDYSFSNKSQLNWDAFISVISTLDSCREKWIAERRDYHPGTKYNSWTTATISLDKIRSVRKMIPNQDNNEFGIRCNETTILIKTDKLSILFLPSDIILKTRVSTFSYSYAQITSEAAWFSYVNDFFPNDSELLGYTWQYVNKDGSQDLRFKDNPRRYRCKYGKVVFATKEGFNLEIDTSNNEIAKNINETYKAYRNSIFRYIG